ncbi:MAG: sulfotransferase family protein [Proteobacteria bacterium]|nr:sulfotransferase family protein [Pseudomonadota bacterium]
MGLRLVGAGFGRTGTLSLKLALETLGVGPCYHMLEVRRNPDHVSLWSRAADGEPVDWDALFAGYAAAVDWPACRFWRELAERYPESRVLLSLRDPEDWYDSVRQTIYRVMKGEVSGIASDHLDMVRKLVLEQTFGGRFEDRAHAIDVFRRHNQEVQEAVAPGRLLVFEASQGWEPLCAFLGRPVPDEPYPRVNTREQTGAMLEAAVRNADRRGA